jgi:DNA-binding Lrp family transcriptional regulator
MAGWTLITNHGMVLTYLARHSRSTAREVAQAVGITERTTHRIIADLVGEGYISRRREGRRNIYRVNPRLPLRHPTHGDEVVGDLLIALGWRPRVRKLTRNPLRD